MRNFIRIALVSLLFYLPIWFPVYPNTMLTCPGRAYYGVTGYWKTVQDNMFEYKQQHKINSNLYLIGKMWMTTYNILKSPVDVWSYSLNNNNFSGKNCLSIDKSYTIFNVCQAGMHRSRIAYHCQKNMSLAKRYYIHGAKFGADSYEYQPIELLKKNFTVHEKAFKDLFGQGYTDRFAEHKARECYNFKLNVLKRGEYSPCNSVEYYFENNMWNLNENKIFYVFGSADSYFLPQLYKLKRNKHHTSVHLIHVKDYTSDIKNGTYEMYYNNFKLMKQFIC